MGEATSRTEGPTRVPSFFCGEFHQIHVELSQKIVRYSNMFQDILRYMVLFGNWVTPFRQYPFLSDLVGCIPQTHIQIPFIIADIPF